MALPQNMVALKRANEIRLGRSKVKRAILRDEMSVADAMGLDCCQSATVWCLLMAQRRWGPARTIKALVRAEVGQSRRVENTTLRQREAVREITARGDAR